MCYKPCIALLSALTRVSMTQPSGANLAPELDSALPLHVEQSPLPLGALCLLG